MITGVSVVVITTLLLLIKPESRDGKAALTARVKIGHFEVPVRITGELQAKKSVDISGPEALRNRNLGIRDIKILDIVPEGTVVDSGDYVARLDKTEALSKLKDIEDELEKRKSEYITTRLDTAMELKELRNRLIDLQYMVEEQKIKMTQSQYEQIGRAHV